jgi:uncharacterized membrane protein YeaQ/YmgE (transglycosylase-associated protein family)
MDMITSVAHASGKGHIVAIVMGVLSAVSVNFLADPHVGTYIHAHWWAKYVMTAVSGIAVALTAYFRAQEPIA